MNKITAKELAAMLDGREYLHEITEEEEQLAKENGLVVVFGFSDDLVELLGAINNEAVCDDDHDELVLNKYGVVYHPLSPHVAIKQIWKPDCGGTRAYETDVPHETFHILDDGELYCTGIVFSINDLPCSLEEELATLADYRAICPDPNKLKAELERLKRAEAERDAVVRDIETILRTGVISCAVCKWITKDGCSKWKPTTPCCEIAEWRGVQATPEAPMSEEKED